MARSAALSCTAWNAASTVIANTAASSNYKPVRKRAGKGVFEGDMYYMLPFVTVGAMTTPRPIQR